MSADTRGGADPGPSPTGADLTKFQTRILLVLHEDPDYGLGIKRALEEYYGKEVNHGRLYPNLDQLVDADLLEKSELDRRTNQYELTTRGYGVIEDELDWMHDQIDGAGGDA
ncbi:helix-turn-helix transcriptional regulator [Halorubellus sp. JP-L1]|uniref:PadR family transcriptional regulator n=1 Tax=Halorubellus sp. JP-L1 TaxID=2715753 RepID=UPI0014078AAA|nr:PadR family transcriptional regulator [Halorubellus sp. JP-L1]NHN40512.1 helix-turn-helix transcriptional regulator [Halorubellus sp. JP-L1]